MQCVGYVGSTSNPIFRSQWKLIHTILFLDEACSYFLLGHFVPLSSVFSPSTLWTDHWNYRPCDTFSPWCIRHCCLGWCWIAKKSCDFSIDCSTTINKKNGKDFVVTIVYFVNKIFVVLIILKSNSGWVHCCDFDINMEGQIKFKSLQFSWHTHISNL